MLFVIGESVRAGKGERPTHYIGVQHAAILLRIELLKGRSQSRHWPHSRFYPPHRRLSKIRTNITCHKTNITVDNEVSPSCAVGTGQVKRKNGSGA